MTFTWLGCDPATAAYALFLSAILLTGWIETEYGPQPVYAVQDWRATAIVPWDAELRLPLSAVPDPAPGNVTLFRVEAADEWGNVSWGDGGCR